MSRLLIVSAIAAVCCLPAGATEPGEPLGCDELVVLDPKLTCEEVIRPCGDLGESDFRTHCGDLITLDIDNEGNIYSWARSPLDPCGEGGLFRHELIRFDGITESVVASIDDRCVDPETARRDHINFAGLRFDSLGGKLYFNGISSCREGPNFPCDNAQGGSTQEFWLGAIVGFPTLVEVLKEEIAPESLSSNP